MVIWVPMLLTELFNYQGINIRMASKITTEPTNMTSVEESSMQTVIQYTKNTAAVNDLGSKFEYGMCAVVYLRLLGSRKPFLLGSNVGDLGKFDDVFIKDKSHVFLIQLKHKENSSRPQTLNKQEGEFSFNSYYKSYCEIEDSLREDDCKDNLKLVKDVPFDNFHFILYCNHPVKHNSINVPKHNSMQDVLSTGGSEGSIFSYNQDDNEVMNFLSVRKDFKRRCKFLSKFIIFSNQGSADDVLQLVKHMVAERTQMTVEEIESTSSKYLQHIVSWWKQRISAPFLTQHPPQWFTDLDIRPTSLLAMESMVEFQGHEVPLSELCGQDILTKDVLMAVRNRVKIRLGNQLPSGVKFYVPRELQHQTVLKVNVLVEVLENDLMAVTNCPSDLNLSSSVVRISADRDEYLKLCKTVVNKNIHWVFFQGELLIWRETQGDGRVVKSYVDVLSDRCSRTAGVCSHKGTPVEKWQGKLQLVTGQPGMGKSSLLKQLALDCKMHSPSSWVMFVALNDYTEVLRDMNQGRVSFNKVVDLLHKATSDGKSMYPDMEKKILIHSLTTTGNVYIFLDAVDEVSPSFKDTTLKLVRVIEEQMRVQELWISSRTVLEGTLQDNLSSVPLVLQPFTQQQQIHYLHQCGIGRHEAEHVLQQLSSPGRHICDVPLHVRLLADIIPSLKLDTPGLNINLPNLYEKFFILKHDIYYYEKMKHDPTNVPVEEEKDEKLENFFRIHMHYALLALLDKEQCDVLDISPIQEQEKFDIDGMRKQRLGIIEGGSYDSIKFVHISYAEYLVARWFKHQYQRELTSSSGSSHSRHYKLLIDWGLKNVQFILDQMFTERYQLHEMVLKGDVDAVKQILVETPEEVNQLDVGSRNALHLAVLYTRLGMINLLLQAGCATGTRDQLMAWRPISYADYIMSWQAVVVLLRYEDVACDLETFKREVPEELTRQSIISAAKIGNKNTDKMFEILGYNFSDYSLIDALYLSVATGDIDLLKKLLVSCRKDLRLYYNYEVGGNISFLKKLLVCCTKSHRISSINPMECRSYKRTFLQEAIACGNIEVTKVLLQEGADVDARDYEGCTALHYAVRLGHRSYFEILNAPPADDNEETVGREYVEIVHYLLGKGADIQACDGLRRTPLHWATGRGHLKIIQCLLDKGAHIKAGDRRGRTPLHMAAENGHLETVQYLLEEGADVQAPDNCGWTPLHLAAKNGHHKTLIYLLEKGADIQTIVENGWIPLHMAAENGHLETVQYLLEERANAQAPDEYGRTPLHMAALNGHLETVQYLLEEGADVQAPDENGWTSLHMAARNGHLETVQYLLKERADVQACDVIGQAPLHMAAENGHLETVRCLLNKGADVQASDRFGRTPLHLAAENGHHKILQYLLEEGADVQASDRYGRTPLQLAADNGH